MPRRATSGLLIIRSVPACNSSAKFVALPQGQIDGTPARRTPRHTHVWRCASRTEKGTQRRKDPERLKSGPAGTPRGLKRGLEEGLPWRWPRQASTRRQHHHHLPAFHARLRFHFGDGLGVGLHALQNLPAELLVGELAAAKPQRHLHLVAVFEKPLDGAHLHVVVVIVDAGPHLDLFDFDDLLPLAGFCRLLLLLVFVLAVVEDLGHRRRGIRRYLDKVEAGFGSAGQGIGNGDNTKILAGVVDQADFAGADIFIHPRTGWLALWRGSHGTTYVQLSIGCLHKG